MKIVKISILSGLVISALPTFAHTHQELETQNAHLRKQLMEERTATQKIIFQMEKDNVLLSLEVARAWGWKKKVGTFVAGLAIGWIVTSQHTRIGKNQIPGAITAKN